MTYQITKGKQKLQYDDQNIIKKYRGTEIKRKNLIIQIIELNPIIPHTHLIEMLLHYGESSAKRTYENLLNKLEKEGIIVSKKIGTSPNSPRLWSLVTPDLVKTIQFNKLIEMNLKDRIKDLNKMISIIMKFTPYQKAQFLVLRLDEINDRLMTTKLSNTTLDLSDAISKLENEEKIIHKTLLEDKTCFVFALHILNNMQEHKKNATIKMINEMTW